MNTDQLELGFDGQSTQASPRASGTNGGATHHWWFERMRQIVDRAFDWQPAQTPRPQQTWFANSHREVSTSAATDRIVPARNSEEHQVSA